MMGRAVAQSGVAAAEVGIGVAIMGHFQTGFFKESKRINMAQQLDFERTPAGFALGVVAVFSGPAKAGHSAGSGNAGAASDAGVLTAAVGVDDGPGLGWRSIRARSALLGTAYASAWRCQQHSSAGQMPWARATSLCRTPEATWRTHSALKAGVYFLRVASKPPEFSFSVMDSEKP